MLPSRLRGSLSLAASTLLVSISIQSPPALAGANQAVGLRALQIGDCATALAEIPSPDDDAQRLALARCLSQRGDTDPALQLLDAVSDPGLRSYAALVRGEALTSAGRFDATIGALDGLHLPGAAKERIALLRGHAQIELAQWTQARNTLNALLQGALAQANHQASPGGADPGEVRWWLAQGAIRRGEPDKAIPVLQRLWSDNPASAWATKAANWLAEHGHPVQDTSTQAGRALVAARIRTLQSARRYPEALALQDSLGTASSPSSEARLAFRAKDYARAVAAFARLPSPTPAQRFDHAVAMTRTGDYDAAAVLYRALVDAAPTSKQADQASYKLGYLAYDAGRLDDAIQLFAQHLDRYPSSRYTQDALWFSAWSLLKLQRLDEAATALDRFLHLHGNSEMAPNAAYWRAWIRQQTGDSSGASAGWEALISRWPISGAAWMASERLNVHPAGVPTSGPPPDMPSALQTGAWHRGKALAGVGLDDWARAELAPLQAPSRAAGAQARIALALALVDAGDYVGAGKLARPFCGTAWKSPGDPWALRACVPRPFHESLRAIAVPAGLDPLLPYAIMRAESAFKPWVTSLAGARGLMQVMPALGRIHHRTLYGDSPYDPALLYQPGYNSTLGTTELADLQHRFSDSGVSPSLPLVIASYNAGVDNVSRWLATFHRPPAGDRFAEDIGYTETRRYVRRVLGYLQEYRYVYGDD